MEAIRTLKDEHRSVAAVLDGMSFLLREIRERGVEPRFDVLGAMLYYIDTFCERLHQRRESEYLFRFLRLRCESAVPVLAHLEEEHRAGALCMQRMQDTLARYRQEGAVAFPAFEAVVESFVNFQSEHMRREERYVLPMAEHHLLPEDWEAIDAAQASGTVPSFSAEALRDHQQLFDRLVQLAEPSDGVAPPSEPRANA